MKRPAPGTGADPYRHRHTGFNSMTTTEKHSTAAPSTSDVPWFTRKAIEASNKAIASAQTAYDFSPGHYTWSAILDARALRSTLAKLARALGVEP